LPISLSSFFKNLLLVGHCFYLSNSVVKFFRSIELALKRGETAKKDEQIVEEKVGEAMKN
jgi:hypothetical protein